MAHLCHDAYMSQTTTPVIVSAAWTAKRLGQPLRTVTRHAKTGVIPTIGKVQGPRGAYLFDRDVIEAIANERGAA